SGECGKRGIGNRRADAGRARAGPCPCRCFAECGEQREAAVCARVPGAQGRCERLCRSETPRKLAAADRGTTRLSGKTESIRKGRRPGCGAACARNALSRAGIVRRYFFAAELC